MFGLFAAGCPVFFWFLLFFLLAIPGPARADVPPKRELRGVWIATVENIDWPSARNLTPEQQRNGINAVFVQVRPAADAFYKSALEPWSKWLTGQQGKAPSPAYDPLPFLIEEAHNRGMEFHAWFNPYRASMDSVTRRLAPTHPFRQHPEWFLHYAGKLLFNPGLPAVRQHINRVILDVVRRYDIDGVHFDDYFYPYPEAGQTIHDEAAFAQFNPDNLTLPNWRRQNVNVLIRDLHDSIQHTKRWVKFGISPFGVWMNQRNDPEGSATSAFEGYSGLYADAREWMRQGWVDYLLPQLYWSSSFKVAAYPVLLEWWARNRFGRHLYIGQGAYRMLETSRRDTAWLGSRELPRQIRLNRSFPADVQGSVFFSSKSLLLNPRHAADSLRLNLFRYPALIPTMPWLDAVPPRPAQSLVLTATRTANTLTWQPAPAAPDGDLAAYYVLYRFASTETPTPDDPRHILALLRPSLGTGLVYVDTTARPGLAYAYYLTAVDRLHNESRPVNVRSTGRSAEIIVARAPVDSPALPATVPPMATAPPASRPTITRPTTSAGGITKIKTKTKAKKKRGFFQRVFGGR